MRAPDGGAGEGRRAVDRLARIRPFAVGDADAIEAILDAAYGDDPRLRGFKRGAHGDPTEKPFRRTVVATLDDEVVGAGTLFHGTFHPAHSWVDVVVAPAYRRRGIATQMVRELRTYARGPVMSRVHCDREGAVAFCDAQGLQLVNRSWEGVLVAELPEPRLDDPPSIDEAASFFARWYETTHAWSPPAPLSHEDAVALFCGETMVEGSLVGVRRHGGLVGAAALSRPESGLHLVWIGAEEADDRVDDLLSACLAFARGGGSPVGFEVDESNAAVHRALDRLGVLGAPTLAFYADPR